MLRNTAIGLAVTASLSLAALTPALADVPNCMKQPNADTCPTMGTPTPSKASVQGPSKSTKHAHSHRLPGSATPQKG
jgi:hypothetical protein